MSVRFCFAFEDEPLQHITAFNQKKLHSILPERSKAHSFIAEKKPDPSPMCGYGFSLPLGCLL